MFLSIIVGIYSRVNKSSLVQVDQGNAQVSTTPSVSVTGPSSNVTWYVDSPYNVTWSFNNINTAAVNYPVQTRVELVPFAEVNPTKTILANARVTNIGNNTISVRIPSSFYRNDTIPYKIVVSVDVPTLNTISGIQTVTGTSSGNVYLRTTNTVRPVSPTPVSDIRTPAPVSGSMITIQSVSTNKVYTINTGLSNGSTIYTDRSFTYQNVPSQLSNAYYIRTSNSDKNNTTNSHLRLVANSSVGLYVAFDRRGVVPSWLSSWQKQSYTIGSSDSSLGSYNVYYKQFNAGTITLGQNNNAPSMYTVFFKGAGSVVASTSSIINGDFSSGLSNWTFVSDNSNNKATVQGSNPAAVIQIGASGGTSQLYQKGIRVTGGQNYRITFSTSTKRAINMNIALIKHYTPFTNYGLNKTITLNSDLGGSFTNNSIDFTVPGYLGNVSDARLRFLIQKEAQSGDAITIDNVKLNLR